jgi:Uma2 family endonuclease
MVATVKQKISVTAFDQFVQQPENADKTFEFIGGEVVEVPSNPYVSEIAQLISFFLQSFLRQNNIKGHITGEAGGYMVAGERYAPDVAYISYERQPELARKGYNPNPPELAVEVISDPDNREEQRQLRMKLTSYLAAGVLVWVVNPEDQSVEVYQSGQSARIVEADGKLDGGDVLPGFEVAVKEIFPPQAQTETA